MDLCPFPTAFEGKHKLLHPRFELRSENPIPNH